MKMYAIRLHLTSLYLIGFDSQTAEPIYSSAVKLFNDKEVAERIINTAHTLTNKAHVLATYTITPTQE